MRIVSIQARAIAALAALLASAPAWAQEATVPSPAPTAASAIRAALPRDLSPWNMFLTADSVVKAVIIGLAFASVITWTVCVAKAIELIAVKRRLRRALAALGTARSLGEAAQLVPAAGPAGELVRAVAAEAALSGDGPADGIKERAGSRLERIESARGRAWSRGTGFLATVGATAPFIGLFGTVWGIMNSFIGISRAQTTNLAVVAPGIAEALLATALGLVAAIPAVVIYNVFARNTAGCRALLGDVAASLLRLLSRDLDRGAGAGGTKLRVAAE